MLQILQTLLIVNLIISSSRLLYFIQLKEYRLDRIIDFLKYDKGKREIFYPELAAVYLTFVFHTTSVTALGLMILLIIALIINLKRIYEVGFIRFKPTNKSMGILILSLSLSLSLIVLYPTYDAINFAYIMAPILIIGLVAGFKPFDIIARNILLRMAAKKIAKFKDLKIVGITGSYGKTSVKEFAYQILSSKYKVLKTPRNINSEIGIARLILSDLNDDHEVFVVEMGAYGKGEIAAICRAAKPDVAVLTAISPQHLSLFGSIQNIKAAKSEIFTFARPEGIAIINGDNPLTKEVAANVGMNVWTYGTDPECSYKIRGVKSQRGKLSFKLNGKNFESHVLGDHQAGNISAAIIIAIALGVSAKNIEASVAKLIAADSTLTLRDGIKKSKILDDSYNSNPDGFMAAMDEADKIKAKKRILITPGMIELGSASNALHQKVADKASDIFTDIVITKKEIYDPFKPLENSCLLEDPDLIIAFLKKKVDSDTVILLESRVFQKVKDFLILP